MMRCSLAPRHHVAPFDDTMLLSYVLDAGKHGHGMDSCREMARATSRSLQGGGGTGKSMITFDQVPVDKATEYAAEDADITLAVCG
jgi:DNA polymerase-1